MSGMYEWELLAQVDYIIVLSSGQEVDICYLLTSTFIICLKPTFNSRIPAMLHLFLKDATISGQLLPRSWITCSLSHCVFYYFIPIIWGFRDGLEVDNPSLIQI